MKLGLRIFGCYVFVFLLCFSYPVGWVLDTLRVRYLEGVEDPLVDQANILAGLMGRALENKTFDRDELYRVFQDVYQRNVNARIYQLTKTRVDAGVYVTDDKGVIVFDALEPSNVGKSFRHWRDVGLTLDGRYGARSTLADPKDPTSSVLYVAAPILIHGRIAGVVTVGKPTTTINTFLKGVKPQLIKSVTGAFAVAAVLSYLIALWITRPIHRLTAYAESIRDGRGAPFPVLDRTEIGDMGRALRKMQAALEGKTYIEQYVQKLTHEVKSPLSAIRGAAELLEEEVPAERRKRFLSNIRTEADRIQTIVDRMLELAALEVKQQLNQRSRIKLISLIHTVIESKRPMLSKKQISMETIGDGDIVLTGDPFLLHQALANLVQNAIDFSSMGGQIEIRGTVVEHEQSVRIEVIDSGSTIPDYALEKVFDKFFSLQRPDSGKKSTGLGLSFVKQVAHMHQGGVFLENRSPEGVRAVLTLPL